MVPNRSNRRAFQLQATRAFTILELLVVMAIIGVLAATLLVAGNAMINTAKTRSTRGILIIVRDAIEEFHEEQTANPTLTRHPAYQARYGVYPPDELEVFTGDGIPYANPPTETRAVGGAVVVPGPDNGVTYGNMLFYTDGLTTQEAAEEHRDLAAMLLAIDMFSESAGMMLDCISSSHRVLGPLDATGNPAQFLNRNPDENETFDPMGDGQIQYIVDDWGVPIAYFAQRDFDPDAPSGATLSTNHPSWNEASTEMIRANMGQPILCSYGPDGQEQLKRVIVTAADSTATLVQDWADDQRINDPLNEDNVYPDQLLKERLRGGAPSP